MHTSTLTERVFAAVAYSVSVLWRTQAGVERPIAALVLGSEAGPPAPLPAAVLRLLSEHLSQARDGLTQA